MCILITVCVEGIYSGPNPRGCVFAGKNTPKLTPLLQNGRSRSSLNSIWRKQRGSQRGIQREQPHTENKKADEKGEENCQAVCSHLSRLERGKKREKTKTRRRLGRLEKGEHKGGNGRKRRRGRGREQICAKPQKALSAFEAGALEQAVASTS